jgi:hypothetical protein
MLVVRVISAGPVVMAATKIESAAIYDGDQ